MKGTHTRLTHYLQVKSVSCPSRGSTLHSQTYKMAASLRSSAARVAAPRQVGDLPLGWGCELLAAVTCSAPAAPWISANCDSMV